MKYRLLLLLSLLLFLVITTVICDLPPCTKDETTYTYTECDEHNGRWSVQVPKDPDQCAIDNPQPPVRGNDCGFSCEAGHYLDLATQQCLECPAGTFSLGSGVRYDSWDTLPEGFTAHSEAVAFTQYGYTSKVNNCSVSKWKPAGQYVISNDDDCTSSLSFAVELKKSGTVSFSYQYSDEDIIFHFYVQNDECQTSQDRTKNVFLNTTGTEWKTWRANIEQGPHVLYWKTTGIMIGNRNKLNPVRIRDIEITGVSYTTECHRCRAGFYSSMPGSHWCDLCPADHYSTAGATVCEECNSETEFAPLASEKCFNKPPCQEKDYFATHTACDENKMTSVTYEWIEPKTCLETLEGSVKLPPSGQKQPCAPCNPGFYPSEASCISCPENTYSNGTHACESCPASTSPHYGLYYLWWDQLPETMTASCISLTRADCLHRKAWEAVGDKVQTTSTNSGEAYLILVLKLPGYMEEIHENLFGKVTFVFELDCENDCQFYFMKDHRNQGTTVIESWRGYQGKQTYNYDVGANDSSITFTWAFQKGISTDAARIFLVNATNVIGSSADSCVACAAGMARDSKCIPCPSGNYLNVDTHECAPCAGNSKLNPDKTGCLACGHGTTATADHTTCESDCHFISPTTGRHYDFTKLSSSKSVSTSPSFTSTGRRYNHVYNFSLCNNEGQGKAECIDNVTYAHSGLFNQDSLQRLVGMACRSTAIPMVGSHSEDITVHSQPTMLATTLQSVTQNASVNGTTSEQIFPKDDPADLNDVVFHMDSMEDSDSCPQGRHTYIHVRCSPDVTEETGRVEMRRGCPDGTCDGCEFYFLWRSIEACPVCTEVDYEEVVGACAHGKVTTKYLWKRYPRKCKGGVELPEEKTDACQDFTFYIELGVAGGLALLILMCTMVCCLWKKSKKLEYRYHRLVMDGKGGSNGGELPAADSCAISDSESDYEQSDEVIFQKKKARLFGKSKVTDYESVVLQPMSTGV